MHKFVLYQNKHISYNNVLMLDLHNTHNIFHVWYCPIIDEGIVIITCPHRYIIVVVWSTSGFNVVRFNRLCL